MENLKDNPNKVNDEAYIRDSIKKNYTESRRIIKQAQKENQFVLFVGAGASMDSGMPSWPNAINLISERLGIGKDNKTDMLRIPQYYYNSRGKKEYTQFMRRIFRAGEDLELKPVHKEIMRLNAQTIVTTNYDHLLEKAAEDNAEVLDVVCCNEDLPYRKGGKELIKIHGDFEHDNFVLKEDDYLAYSRNFGLIENYVKSLIGTKVVLFFGYSFNDPDIKQIFDWARDALKGDFQRAYLIELGNEYSPDEEEYYKRFGINVLYASIELDDYKTLSISQRALKMLSWINEDDKISLLDQLYLELKPFSFLKYAYGKYVANAFREIGLFCDNGIISYFAQGYPQEAIDVLNKIAYQMARENEECCYVYVGKDRVNISIPSKYKSEETQKIAVIINVLEKSAIERLDLALPVDKEFPLLEHETEVFNTHQVYVEVTHEPTPSWIEAVNNFDYKKLQTIEEHNDEKLNYNTIDLYIEQAYISYFRKRYLKAYNLMRTYTKLLYKRERYAEYFFAETCRKYIGQFITSRYLWLGIEETDKNSVANEIKAIDLDRTYNSLPDLGGNNEIFKDLYTFNIAYSMFRESYIQSRKVLEQAEKMYSVFAGMPAYELLKNKVIDFYRFEINNAVALDEYDENREIFKLYFNNMLLSITSPDKGNAHLESISDGIPQIKNVHAKMLEDFEIFVAARYIGTSELKELLRSIGCNLMLSDHAVKYMITIISNSEFEPVSFYSDRLIWKMICLLGHIRLSKEMVLAALKVINASTTMRERGENRDIINLFLVNAEKQGILDGECGALLYDFVDIEIKSLGTDKAQISFHDKLLINGTFFCHKYNQPYDKISYFKKLYNTQTEMVLLECYPYWGASISGYLNEQVKGWHSDGSYKSLRSYCMLVGNNMITPDPAVEHEIYEFCINEKTQQAKSGVVTNHGISDLFAHVAELYLQKKVADIDGFKNYVSVHGSSYYKWLTEPKSFNYIEFNTEWLRKCYDRLLRELSMDNEIKHRIAQKLTEEYKKNGLPEDLVKCYFSYFASDDSYIIKLEASDKKKKDLIK